MALEKGPVKVSRPSSQGTYPQGTGWGADLMGTRGWGDRSPDINKRPNKEHDAPRNWHRSGALPCFPFPDHHLQPHPHLPWHGLGRAAVVGGGGVVVHVRAAGATRPPKPEIEGDPQPRQAIPAS